MRIAGIAAALLGAMSVGAALAQQASRADPALVQQAIDATFKSAPADWQARIAPDATLKICSQYRNDPPKEAFAQIQARELATIVYPADGVLLGNWKNGEQLAQRGTGGQFSDTPSTPIGGNCYACHQMAAKELSYGTLGPSLLEYGKNRKFNADDAKAAYAKIYNAQAAQPCSNMPRFGHNKFLNEQQIKDLTAYLFDPESPVNK